MTSAGPNTLVFQCDGNKELQFVIASTNGQSFRGERYLSGGTKQIDFKVRVDTNPTISFRTFGVGRLALIPQTGAVFDRKTFPSLLSDLRGAKSQILASALSASNSVLEDTFPASGAGAAIRKVEAACQ